MLLSLRAALRIVAEKQTSKSLFLSLPLVSGRALKTLGIAFFLSFFFSFNLREMTHGAWWIVWIASGWGPFARKANQCD